MTSKDLVKKVKFWQAKMGDKIDYQKAIDNSPDVELIRGDIKVEWEYIGEGCSGDYTGEADDIPLWRFCIWYKEPVDDPNTGTEHPDWDWNVVDDGSYCTQMPITASEETLRKAAELIMDRVEDEIPDGRVRKICEELSWIDERWVENPDK